MKSRLCQMYSPAPALTAPAPQRNKEINAKSSLLDVPRLLQLSLHLHNRATRKPMKSRLCQMYLACSSSRCTCTIEELGNQQKVVFARCTSPAPALASPAPQSNQETNAKSSLLDVPRLLQLSVHLHHRGTRKPMKSRLCYITLGISWEIKERGVQQPRPPHTSSHRCSRWYLKTNYAGGHKKMQSILADQQRPRIEPKCGGEGCWVLASEYSCAHRAQIMEI